MHQVRVVNLVDVSLKYSGIGLISDFFHNSNLVLQKNYKNFVSAIEKI